MMLAIIAEAALRSGALALAILLGLKALRIVNPHVLMATWQLVLASSLLMPLMLGRAEVNLPPASLPVPPLMFKPPGPVSAAVALLPPLSMLSAPAATAPRIDWRLVAGAIYWLGVGLMSLRLLIGTAFSWRLCHIALPVRDDWTAGRDVRASSFVQIPLTFGSTILLPASHTRWDVHQRRAVMAHEAAHIDGGDFLVLMISAINRAIFWFSPIAWWLHQRLMSLAEARSDAVAIEQVDDRLRYAEILLAFGAQTGRRTIGLAIAAPHTIRQRIERILAQTAPPKRLGWPARLALVACVLPLVGVAACAVAQAPSNAAQSVSPDSTAASHDAATVARLLEDQKRRRKEIPIDLTLLDDYVGYYQLTPYSVMTVTRESDHLMVRFSGERSFEVYPESAQKFFSTRSCRLRSPL